MNKLLRITAPAKRFYLPVEVAVMIFVAGVFLWFAGRAIIPPIWGSRAFEEKLLTSVMERKPWPDPASVHPGGTGERGQEVFIKLLEVDRDEIKFWQNQLFTISFWVTAAILGILSFILRKPAAPAVRVVSAAGCLSLGIFQLVFVNVAERAMVANDFDLVGIQTALGLRTPGFYSNGFAIYGEATSANPSSVMGHDFVFHIAIFCVLLVIVAVMLILWPREHHAQSSSAVAAAAPPS